MNIKRFLSMVLLLLVLSLGLSSCDFSGISNTTGGGNTENPETPENPENPEQPEDDGEKEENQTLTYEEYINFTAEEQEAYIYSFEDIRDFFLWHAEAKAKYDEEHKPPEIEGDIDLGEILGPQE